MKRHLVSLVVLCLCGPLFAEIQLSGVISMNGADKFLLADTEKTAPARWLAIGDQLNGFTIISYNAAAESLILQKKPGLPIKVKLQTGKITAVAASEPVDMDKLTPVELASMGMVRVEAGDTLGKIARAHQVSVGTLAMLNTIADPTKLRVGQILIFSDENKPGQAPAPSPAKD